MSAEIKKNPAETGAERRDVVNVIRALAMDAVQKANSGHPGMPMGMAEIAEVLWRRHLRHNPANPHWADRDRFVVSNGHGSMLLYALLHLTGYDLPIEQLQRFRRRKKVIDLHLQACRSHRNPCWSPCSAVLF